IPKSDAKKAVDRARRVVAAARRVAASVDPTRSTAHCSLDRSKTSAWAHRRPRMAGEAARFFKNVEFDPPHQGVVRRITLPLAAAIVVELTLSQQSS
ncbi:MAG: hypothetical protein KY454_10095, partial [Actinobacteria bacterium]|nr:hypothetical protein [Actinomycetota bacterium]